MDVAGGWPEASAQIDLNADPAAALRIMGALLLRKARIHAVAVLRANETSNLHSLAVQMRPVPNIARCELIPATALRAVALQSNSRRFLAAYGPLRSIVRGLAQRHPDGYQSLDLTKSTATSREIFITSTPTESVSLRSFIVV